MTHSVGTVVVAPAAPHDTGVESELHQHEGHAVADEEPHDEPCSGENWSNLSGCLEQTSLEQMSDEAEEFDSLIDRIMAFQYSKNKKWYMFWR